MGRCPIPRQGTCPLHPEAKADMEFVQALAAQILAAEAQAHLKENGNYR